MGADVEVGRPAPVRSGPGSLRGASAKSAALRNEVLALPSEERAELAAELLASLDDIDDADPGRVDQVWGEELVRRSAQLAAGEVTGVSWDQVLERVAENRRPR